MGDKTVVSAEKIYEQLFGPIEGAGAELARTLMAALPPGNNDARVVMLACGTVAGSFLHGVQDPEVRYMLFWCFAHHLQQYAGCTERPDTIEDAEGMFG